MADRQNSGSYEPYHALADHARVRMAYLGSELMQDRRYSALSTDQNSQFEALMIGLLSGVAGIAIAHIKPEGHGEVRAALLALIPFAMNNAREIMDLPPLEALQ
ncbi:hypothetical protein [Nitratireductor sp.]|uniref:hypothetical protein n=1 Tax=Nitratireductor sp. TaxID=1872084 RepID=UPI00262EA0CE|nr:hypothetical protein [Nitratireductor sp.]MCV0379029.1 hypothetical protein [Nitratireductor sp.]